MIAEKQIEKTLVDKLRSMFDDVYIAGSWQNTTLKDHEENQPVAIKVLTAPRLYQTHTMPTCDISISIVCAIRYDADPDGNKLVDIATGIMNMLQRWQHDINLVVDDFTVEGQFDPAGLRLDGGTPPSVDVKNGIWTLSQDLTIRGYIINN